MEKKPDLIVVRGFGAPDAFATIAIANMAYAAAQEDREVSVFTQRAKGGNGQQRFVSMPKSLAHDEALQNFRYIFGYDNARSTQSILQEAERSNLVLFFGYCLPDDQMEKLLEINPNVYVYDYHASMPGAKVRRKLCLYEHDENRCAAHFAWDFFVSERAGQYPLLVTEVAESIFKNSVHARELFFGLTGQPFKVNDWVNLLSIELRNKMQQILSRGRHVIDYCRILENQFIDCAYIARIEDQRAVLKRGLTRVERADDAISVYNFQCPTPIAQYFIRYIKDLSIARRSIILMHNQHNRNREFYYVLTSNCFEVTQLIEAEGASFFNNVGCFTSNQKPQSILNSIVERVAALD